jgi:hypothetical protein
MPNLEFTIFIYGIFGQMVLVVVSGTLNLLGTGLFQQPAIVSTVSITL